MLIFITGGVRSGKSTFAEKLAIEKAKNSPLHYIATSKRNDIEMEERIMRHKQRRIESGVHWQTWEMEKGLANLHTEIENNRVVLLDCLTTLLNNELFGLTEEGEFHFLGEKERKRLFDSLIGALHTLQLDRVLIVVSNELFYDVPVKDETTFIYTAMLGMLHQKIVQLADEAYVCENGIPIQMK
ncbi:cobinamide kinase [Pueribacillus theae]|uniref:Adenosylcobinamide kinase n=1 Tax=Pueribacillus theae TaxID=2171751 RepID=A0A2U1K3W0_9BACI|nr:bifunctional adenosylcobinamide kinase/adenosylcobinamide-phosphate guanylyltransferase [Pueribacillus theae]PWA12220.1 cobinamide kinase [Pueribacillus theae]